LPEIRERALQSGVAELGDAELLSLLLGTGSAGHPVEHVALSLLEAAGGLEGIARFGPHAFAAQAGVGPVKAARLAAALDHEEVWLLCLDGRSGLKATVRVAQGGLHGCALTARDVLAPAVKNAAAAILLVHNHPSGDPRPSPDDVEMTKHVARCADLVGVPLLDHVVVATGGARSVLHETEREQEHEKTR
jgi:DNA repair protein RadC